MQKIIDEVFDELETGRKEQFAMLCTKVLEGLPKSYLILKTGDIQECVRDVELQSTIELIRNKVGE